MRCPPINIFIKNCGINTNDKKYMYYILQHQQNIRPQKFILLNQWKSTGYIVLKEKIINIDFIC